MSQRDELANLILDHFRPVDGQFRLNPGDAADAILAAGYSRPRVVETVEQLEALPEDSIVLDACGCAYRKDGSGRTVWLGFGDEAALDWTCVDLPATVLYVPEEAK